MGERAEIVDLLTEDNVAMTGAFWDAAGSGTTVDAWLLLPGAGFSFYNEIQRPFGPTLAARGYPALAISTRGHDLAWTNPRDGRLLGLANDIISETGRDIRAGLAHLADRGYRCIGLLGHSMGGIKGCYFLATEGDSRVAAFAMVSAQRIGRSVWQDRWNAADLARAMADAEACIAAGTGDVLRLFDSPTGRSYITPRALVDRFGDDRYDNSVLVADIRVPLLILRGSEEPKIVPDELMATQLARAVHANPRRGVTIAGAGHFYENGTHLAAVAAIDAFVRDLVA